MYLVKDLFDNHKERLSLEIIAGQSGIKRPIKVPEAQCPGLSLAGYHKKSHTGSRILIFGRVEIEYLRELDSKVRIERLDPLLAVHTPAVVVSRRYLPPKELIVLCDKKKIPLFRSPMSTMKFLTNLIFLLHEEFAPNISYHGTLVEVFGVGVLIEGSSSVGKSEAALGLIEKGHCLISDDIVMVKKREGNHLEGSGVKLTKHHLEIRGIGIINVANLYGAACVRDSKGIDIVVKLEQWDDDHFYDRVGLEEKFCTILGVQIPHHLLPVKPGRDVVLLLETIARNHRLKKMGYNSAAEFQIRFAENLATHRVQS
jgi:HPr kinase/phosphorylase